MLSNCFEIPGVKEQLMELAHQWCHFSLASALLASASFAVIMSAMSRHPLGPIRPVAVRAKGMICPFCKSWRVVSWPADWSEPVLLARRVSTAPATGAHFATTIYAIPTRCSRLRSIAFPVAQAPNARALHQEGSITRRGAALLLCPRLVAVPHHVHPGPRIPDCRHVKLCRLPERSAHEKHRENSADS